MTTTVRTLPGIYMASPAAARVMAPATLGHEMEAHGPRGHGGPGWTCVPGIHAPRAGMAFNPPPWRWNVGTQPIDPRAPDLLRAAVLGGGATQSRRPYPTAFGRLGGESPLYNRANTPAASVDEVIAAYTGPAGAVITERTGPGAPASYAPDGFLTPGEYGRTTPQAPWWGAPPIAGAPAQSGTDTQPMPTGNARGTQIVGAPIQAPPDYMPIPGAPDNTGGHRIFGPGGGIPPNLRQPTKPNAQARRTRTLAILAALGVGFWLWQGSK